MGSDLPKVLQPLSGRPMLSYLFDTISRLRPGRVSVVIGHQAGRVRSTFRGEKVRWILQKRQLGTAHATLTALAREKNLRGRLFILYGDVPLLSLATLKKMQEVFLAEKPSLLLLTTFLDDPKGYGRIIRNGTGRIARIIEEREATPEEAKIQEVNSGIYLANAEEILAPLQEITRSRRGKEYYLTDLVEQLLRGGKKVVSLSTAPEGCLGINSPEELADAEGLLRRQRNRDWIRKGVILRQPDSVAVDPAAILEPGVVLHQGVIIEGACRIERGAVILPYSVIESSRVRAGARVGPFAHLRPGSDVGRGAHVGNYVELKKATLKAGVKANHLSYLGDAVVGEGTNVGAGTITCNYDGFKKHRTTIGKKVFIGSDVQFVAPVKIADEAWIGAGTTVTKHVPRGALALSRVNQENRLGWVRQKVIRSRPPGKRG